jgi:hypothetical protein
MSPPLSSSSLVTFDLETNLLAAPALLPRTVSADPLALPEALVSLSRVLVTLAVTGDGSADANRAALSLLDCSKTVSISVSLISSTFSPIFFVGSNLSFIFDSTLSFTASSRGLDEDATSLASSIADSMGSAETSASSSAVSPAVDSTTFPTFIVGLPFFVVSITALGFSFLASGSTGFPTFIFVSLFTGASFRALSFHFLANSALAGSGLSSSSNPNSFFS